MSPQVLRTTRRLPKETLSFEPFTGIDGQGASAYGPATSFAANVAEQGANRGREFVVMPDGSQVRTPYTIYVEGDYVGPVPSEQDRVTLDGRRFIVAERTAPRGLDYGRDAVDHYRLRLRAE